MFYLFINKDFIHHNTPDQQSANQQSRETVVGTSASITVSSVTTLNNTF